MEPLSMTLSDLWLRIQGHDIFRHWISQKRHEIEPLLLWNVNRKSYALYRIVKFPMTLTDPWPGFQGHGIFKVEYLKNSVFRDKPTKEH